MNSERHRAEPLFLSFRLIWGVAIGFSSVNGERGGRAVILALTLARFSSLLTTETATVLGGLCEGWHDLLLRDET